MNPGYTTKADAWRTVPHLYPIKTHSQPFAFQGCLLIIAALEHLFVSLCVSCLRGSSKRETFANTDGEAAVYHHFSPQ